MDGGLIEIWNTILGAFSRVWPRVFDEFDLFNIQFSTFIYKF